MVRYTVEHWIYGDIKDVIELEPGMQDENREMTALLPPYNKTK